MLVLTQVYGEAEGYGQYGAALHAAHAARWGHGYEVAGQASEQSSRGSRGHRFDKVLLLLERVEALLKPTAPGSAAEEEGFTVEEAGAEAGAEEGEEAGAEEGAVEEEGSAAGGDRYLLWVDADAIFLDFDADVASEVSEPATPPNLNHLRPPP